MCGSLKKQICTFLCPCPGFEAVKPGHRIREYGFTWLTGGDYEDPVDCMHAVMKRPDCDQGTGAAYVLANVSGADQGCVGERGATCASLAHIIMMTRTKQRIYTHRVRGRQERGDRDRDRDRREWVSKRQRRTDRCGCTYSCFM